MTGLAPTAITLATYFCISDVILIAQCVYYNTLNARKARQQHADALGTAVNGSAVVDGEAECDGEQAPLLGRRRSSAAGGLPGSHRRHSARLGHEESGLDSLKRVITGEDETPDRNPWLHNVLGLVAVWIIGALGWFISYRAGAWDGPDTPDAPKTDSPVAVVGMVLGYASALCYLWCVIHGSSLPSPMTNGTGLTKIIVRESLRSSRITGRSPAKVMTPIRKSYVVFFWM